jgi:hypothetical protein
MTKVPYALAMGNLINAMVATRSDLAHAIRITSCYMGNPRFSNIFHYFIGMTD